VNRSVEIHARRPWGHVQRQVEAVR
jgi:hypothetical protein